MNASSCVTSVLSFILAIAFVLLLSRLMAVLAETISLILISHHPQDRGEALHEFRDFFGVVLPPLSPPLRI